MKPDEGELKPDEGKMGRKRGTGADETEFGNPISEDNDIDSDNSDDAADADSKPRQRRHTVDLDERPNRPLSRAVSNYSMERDTFDGLTANLVLRGILILALMVASIVYTVMNPMADYTNRKPKDLP